MNNALAMYRAGMPVKAEDCDYDSSRRLGLTCPYCHEAVFWKTGHMRQCGTSSIAIAPQFAHYPTDDPMAQDCEARSKTSEGQIAWEKTLDRGKNQRLDLYNKFLINMFMEDRNCNKKMRNQIRKEYGHKWIDETFRKVQNVWRDNLSEAYQEIAQVTEGLSGEGELIDGKYREEHRRISENMALAGTKSDASLQKQYFSGIDRNLHIAICNEIAEFLATRTAGYAFRDLFTLWIRTVGIVLIFSEGVPPDRLVAEVKSLSFRAMTTGMAGAIAGTHWIDQINSRLKYLYGEL